MIVHNFDECKSFELWAVIDRSYNCTIKIVSSLLRRGVGVIFHVEGFAFLAVVGFFAGIGGLSGFRVESGHAFQFSAAIRIFRIVFRYVTNSLPGRFRFHLVAILPRIRIVILTPFQFAAQNIEVGLIDGGNQFHRSFGLFGDYLIFGFQLQSHLAVHGDIDSAFV